MLIGKRMAFGWYTPTPHPEESLTDRLNRLFDESEEQSDYKSQDDFFLVMEDAGNAPSAIDIDNINRTIAEGSELSIFKIK